MIKKYFVIFISILISSIISISYAGKVPAQFAGFWYEDAYPDHYDACMTKYFRYINKFDDKSSLIKILFSNLPSHSNCEWEFPKLSSITNDVPYDFPASDQEYIEATKLAQAPKIEEWTSYCRDSEGAIRDHESRRINPAYKCPVGSRLVYDIYDFRPGSHCDTTPKVCTADVVGRDLNVIGLHSMGHVGLASLVNLNQESRKVKNYVLQVMNKDIVINFDSLRNFKNETTYWGEVYGLPNVKDINSDEALNIIQAGIVQGQYRPEYTYFKQFQEGKHAIEKKFKFTSVTLIDELKNTPAKFRCDTFVAYCYAKGLGIHALNFYTPAGLYKQFLYKRTDVGDDDSILRYQDNSKKLLSENDSLEKTDIETQSYLDRKDIADLEKAKYFWQKAQVAQGVFYSYYVDVIGTLHVHAMIPTLIAAYEKEADIDRKVHLISGVASSAKIHDDENTLTQETIAQLSAAQIFLTSILQKDTNPTILTSAISNTLSIAVIDKDIYQLIKAAIDKIQTNSDEELHFTEKQKYFTLLSMAFANSDMQKWLLPQLLAEKRTNSETEIFVTVLVEFLNSIPPESIDDETKKLIQEFLATLPHLARYSNDRINLPSANITKTLINLKSGSEKEKTDLMVQTLLNEKDLDKLAEMIRSFGAKVLSQLPQKTLVEMHRRFAYAIRDSKTGNMRYGIALTALYGQIHKEGNAKTDQNDK